MGFVVSEASERKKEKQQSRKRDEKKSVSRQSEREREREIVCVRVCVRGRERERERERERGKFSERAYNRERWKKKARVSGVHGLYVYACMPVYVYTCVRVKVRVACICVCVCARIRLIAIDRATNRWTRINPGTNGEHARRSRLKEEELARVVDR